MAMSFAEQIWLSVVDKALLGGLLALGGFYGTRAIEAYKGKQIVRTELTKQRVLKIEDVWNRMLDIQIQIEAFRDSLTKEWIKPPVGRPNEVRLQEARESWRNLVSSKKDAVDEINAKFYDMIHHSVQRDSFWLGRNLTEKVREQLTSTQNGFWHLLSGKTIIVNNTGGGFIVSMVITTQAVDVDYLMNNI